MFDIYKILYIYNFSDYIGKILFTVLFFYSNLYQCFLISIHFSLVCKLASIVSFSKSQFTFTFFTMSISAYLEKVFYLVYKKKEVKQKNCAAVLSTTFCGKLTLALICNMCIKDLGHFVIMF